MKHYQFFQNERCEFFPCHSVKNLETFNCLFCYCPLYTLKDCCGGNFKVLEDGTKDCSHCFIVHGPKGYDHVMSKMREIMELGEIIKNNKEDEEMNKEKCRIKN